MNTIVRPAPAVDLPSHDRRCGRKDSRRDKECSSIADYRPIYGQEHDVSNDGQGAASQHNGTSSLDRIRQGRAYQDHEKGAHVGRDGE